jgi:hypothetical protein
MRGKALASGALSRTTDPVWALTGELSNARQNNKKRHPRRRICILKF